MPRRALAIALFVFAAIAALAPIRSYDAFWHLATGRWIVEHHALPLYDPFGLASAHTPWINGEWLFEVILYAVGSLTAISIVNALIVAGIFSAAFWIASRDADAGAALLAATLAFAGAFDRLGVRPSTAAAALVVAAVALLRSHVRYLPLVYALVTIVWINTHPSAILAPALAAATMLVDRDRWKTVVASALALLVNPFGYHAVLAPIALSREATSGEFVNAEWLPSPLQLFPLLYITIVAGVVLFAMRRERAQWWRFVLFVLFAVLAVRYVRNQGLYFAALPLLVPLPRRGGRAAMLAAFLPLVWVFAVNEHGVGVDATRFPVIATRRLAETKLAGNIYNADQFGGYLEWTFYPARRVLTDGRNELYREVIAEDARARRDSRAWHALLDRYQLDLAVDEYQAERINVIDMASHEQRSLPASLVRFRRRDWALIGFDDVAMVFARRKAFPPEVLARYEFAHLVPDDPAIPQLDPAAARAELQRARRELGDLKVIALMEQNVK